MEEFPRKKTKGKKTKRTRKRNAQITEAKWAPRGNSNSSNETTKKKERKKKGLANGLECCAGRGEEEDCGAACNLGREGGACSLFCPFLTLAIARRRYPCKTQRHTTSPPVLFHKGWDKGWNKGWDKGAGTRAGTRTGTRAGKRERGREGEEIFHGCPGEAM